jgi:hypothetical protein
MLRIGQAVLAAAVIIAVFAFAVPKFASQVTLLVAATAVSVVAPWSQLVASLPGLTFGQAAVNNQTANSMANTVPGPGVLDVGPACGLTYLGWRRRRSWRAPVHRPQPAALAGARAPA